MWEYLDHLATILHDIGQALRVVPESDEELVRRALTGALRRRDTLEPTGIQRKPRSQKQMLPFVTDTDGTLLPGGSLPSCMQTYTAIIMSLHPHRGSGVPDEGHHPNAASVLSPLLPPWGRCHRGAKGERSQYISRHLPCPAGESITDINAL